MIRYTTVCVTKHSVGDEPSSYLFHLLALEDGRSSVADVVEDFAGAARELQGSGGFQEIIECFRRVNEAHESFVVEGSCFAGSGDVDTLLASRGAFVVYLHTCGDEASKTLPSDDAVISKRATNCEEMRVAGSVAIA